MASVEIWKPINGYEGKYEVSNLGRVRSLDRVLYQKDSHGGMMTKHYAGQIVVPADNGNGYKIVMLRSMKRDPRYVHRLVAEAFVQNPNGYAEVNHKDYDKANNSADNLEWVTRRMNVHYSQHRMEKPRRVYKTTMTGEKYITRKGDKWRFSIRTNKIRFDRQYRTLDEAIAAREVVLGGEKHYAG